MANTAPKFEFPAVDQDRLGGLSEAERKQIYTTAGYTKHQIALYETMIAASGQRDVGKGALNNLVTRFVSHKNNGAVRVLESHTCERMFAYLCELDPTVEGYYVQVPCRGIVRMLEGDRKHVSHATLDFFVFRTTGVELVECKDESWLRDQKDGEWRCDTEGWTSHPYKQWAEERGLTFRVFALGTPFANQLRMLEAMYATLNLPLTPEETRIAERALALLAKKPFSIEGMEEALPGFNERIALAMLARQQCHGLVTSKPISLPQHFYLYSDKEQARLVDERAFASLREDTDQPTDLGALALASATDLNAAQIRLARVRRMQAGEEKSTVRMRQLAVAIREAEAQGKPALEACLTQYGNSGNRQTRLDPIQQACLAWAIRALWNTGKVRTRKNLWFELEKECARHQVATPCIETLCHYVRQEAAVKRALVTGGMRAYQAARPISDPLVRSGKALAFGHTLHIDSSQLDSRCMQFVADALFGNKPWFYVGIDEATDYPMASSMYFGSACTNGVALLIRDFVRRHGFLPFVIILDRGSENDSKWLKAFCLETGITLIYTPTGGSRYNSQAEIAIRRININVAHDLPGSTEPDQKGRKVDGKYKSLKTARLMFTTVHDRVVQHFHSDLPNTPNDDDDTPMERKDKAIARYGVMGRPQKVDDDFLIKTSVNIEYKGKATEKRGIKLPCGLFTSDRLSRLLRTARPDEVRKDCENKALIVVKIAHQWVKAFLNTALTEAAKTPEERLLELLMAPYARRRSRNRKRDEDRALYERNQTTAASPAPHPDEPPSSPEVPEEPDAESTEQVPEPDDLDELWDKLEPLAAE